MATIGPTLIREETVPLKRHSWEEGDEVCARPDEGGGLLERTRLSRQQAEALLRSLMAAKSDCEQQLRRFKRTDAMQSVTGRSAFDSAITSTRRLIETLDGALSSAGRPVGA